MSDKNINDDDELKIVTDDNDNLEDYDDNFEDEVYYDNSVIKQKLTKEQIINRVMIGMGAAIAGFTIFYGAVAYNVLYADNTPVINNETESTTEGVQEITTQPMDEKLFVSPYSDADVTEEVKKLLNGVKLKPMDTGLYKLDNRVENVISHTAADSSKTTYEKVRNIYDYMLYYFELLPKSYVDEDTVYEACSSVDYVSYFDMELIYRANQALANNAGSSQDYACALTVLFRKLGLEAYYIDGERITDTGYKSQGYTLVIIDGEQYIFDAAYEDELAENADVGYKVFCKTVRELSDEYTEEGIEESMEDFAEFETLGIFSFSASISADNGDYASGSVEYTKGYSEDGNAVNASGSITVYDDEKLYLSGSVKGSSKNTWKLIAKVYDENMDYITESVIYSETTYSSSNEVSYTPSGAGNIRLVYMVTDEYGRTCTISKTIAVKSRYVATTTDKETESERVEITTTSEPVTEETTTDEEETTIKPDEETTMTESSESDTTKQDEETTASPYKNEN